MFSSIVVGTDGSETAGKAVLQATELARQVGASVSLVSAYEPVSGNRLREEKREVPKDLEWMVNPREDVEATLNEAAESVEGAGVKVDIFGREGDAADAILDVAEEQHADLIVVGNKGMTGAKRSTWTPAFSADSAASSSVASTSSRGLMLHWTSSGACVFSSRMRWLGTGS